MKAQQKNRLVLTVPWVVEYLSMMDRAAPPPTLLQGRSAIAASCVPVTTTRLNVCVFSFYSSNCC